MRCSERSLDVADADMESDEIPTSYVPFRNANLLSMATSYAEATDSEALFIGAHSEDFSGYPDCRPAFFDAFQNVIDVGFRRIVCRLATLCGGTLPNDKHRKAGRRRLVTSFY